ncbi:MAG: phosphoenolpyruvate carboxykinase (GTP) [Planctomycetes bacterium]|nr:phosphoenolpyruvate carboxykinase (GTP) [Planctomycetota bacterium]
MAVLEARLDKMNLSKLLALKNPAMHKFVADAVELCRPDSVFVCTDSAEDVAYVREQSMARGEEAPLSTKGHTIHFDGQSDLARDPGSTKYLVPRGVVFSNKLNHEPKEEGLAYVRELLAGAMAGKQAIVRFFCLGPTNSQFAISCVQVTDSFYVAHSEDLLYRRGYEQFKRMGASRSFFKFLHSAGELEHNISKNDHKRAIRIDLEDNVVYSVNTQYAGNTVGLKKLALRLAINKASREGWLAEHMLLMGVHGPADRVTYLAGAFPSACGKTSTAMIPGETIIGDDLAYLRLVDGTCRAANVEGGIFGIIRDVNSAADPVIWKVLTEPGEVIFSNVLVNDGTPYWEGDGRDVPASGTNYAGAWRKGMKDAEGKALPHSHANSRYTIALKSLANLDGEYDNPQGVPVQGVIYGGRDSDTCPPVCESFDWAHGVITMGASLESETTAAIIGKTGVRRFDLMSNIDFLSMPLGRYIQKHLDFGGKTSTPPKVFAVNYFLRGADGKYLTGMLDKKVWVHWMERRIHGEAEVIRTPIGLIPRYEDIAALYRELLDQDFSHELYVALFAIRCGKLIEKIDRIEKIYRSEIDVPDVLYRTLADQRKRLTTLQKEKGDVVSPVDLAK